MKKLNKKYFITKYRYPQNCHSGNPGSKTGFQILSLGLRFMYTRDTQMPQ